MKFRIEVGTVRYASAGSNSLFYNLTVGHNAKMMGQKIASLMENSPVIRAKALRAVSIIVEADLQVLGDKRVQSAVERKFCDSAISVREAALELVGRHIASHPDVAERVKDTGVSVRKRSIKIIRDVCVSNANFSEFTKACIAIISRTGDDESSIKDIVCKTFYEFWFEEPTGSQTQFFGDGRGNDYPGRREADVSIYASFARILCCGSTLRAPASDPSQFVVTLQPYLNSQFNCISLYQFVV
ncbi:unnamed protein product [Prunus armeniaca]